MKKETRNLIEIKILHTFIWLFFNVVIFYLAYAVFANKIDKWVWWVWWGVGAVFMEGIVLLIFRKKCPLTLVARKYSSSTKDNFDIFLPNWLAKYNKQIYTSLFILILAGLIYRMATAS